MSENDPVVQAVAGLSGAEAREVLIEVIALLYRDLDGERRPIWNPDKEWGADVLAELPACIPVSVLLAIGEKP